MLPLTIRCIISADNGFNPVWEETFEFFVAFPSLALLRFAVYDIDMFGDANLIAQATYPVSCLRRGYRSVPLKNGYSEYLELAALLVHMDIRSPKVLSVYLT
jgi:phosphatidylinositol phospholipase C, gamma-1